MRAVGRDHETFSSSPTISIEGPATDERQDDVHTMMLMADPPLHTGMRRLVSRSFTPRAAAALGPRVAELAVRIVDEVVEQGECDLVNELAGEMPSFVIADVLGIPLEDGRALYHQTETIHSSSEVVGAGRAERLSGDVLLRSAGVRDQAERPADDLASLLANAALEGRPHDEIDFFLWFLLLVDAGGDTTRNLVGGGHARAVRTRRRAGQAAPRPGRADADRGGGAASLGEPGRLHAPHRTRDTVLADTNIAAGDKVVMYYGSANRDPACVADPDRLDLGRAPNPHVAFGGGGPHYCLGAHLARVEIAVLLSEILHRLRGPRTDGRRSMDGVELHLRCRPTYPSGSRPDPAEQH